MIKLENNFISRTIEVSHGILRTVRLGNNITDTDYDVDSDEFLIKLGNSRRLATDDFRVAIGPTWTNDDNGRTVRFDLRNEEFRLNVSVYYRLSSDDFAARKWVEITSGADVLVDSIEVERMVIRGVSPISLTGRSFDAPHLGIEYPLNSLNLEPQVYLGQPVLAGDFFLGLEYPAGHNVSDDSGRIALRHYPGRNLASGLLVSKTAVIGASSSGHVREKFLEYIEQIRVPTEPALNWNTGYTIETLGGTTEETCLDLIGQLKKRMADDNGIFPDIIVIDYGGSTLCTDRWVSWHDPKSVWDVNRETFPNGFHGINDAIRPLGAKLGLWYSLSLVTIDPARGGFIDQEWSKDQGYEMIDENWYCLAGPKYLRDLKANIVKVVQEYDVRYLKWDFNNFICNCEDHGHMPGIHSVEAITDAAIELIQAVREISPTCFIKNTSGMFLSPWWLMYDDAVWMGGWDHRLLSQVPCRTAVDAHITYKDCVLHDNFVSKGYFFPVSGLMMHGVIKGNDTTYLHKDSDPPQKWSDDLVMYFGRGVLDQELIITPSLISSKRWQSLAEVVRWARQNRDVLCVQPRFILGDPHQGGVYGYAHSRAGKSIIILRNPSLEDKNARIPLDRSICMDEGDAEYVAEIVYPFNELLSGTYRFGDSIDLRLGANQVMALHISGSSRQQQLKIRGIRYELDHQDGNLVNFRLFGKPGSTASIEILSPCEILRISSSEGDVPVAFDLHFEGSVQCEKVAAPTSNLTAHGSIAEGLVDVNLTPHELSSELLLLFRSDNDTSALSCSAHINGRDTSVRSLADDFGLGDAIVGSVTSDIYLQPGDVKWKSWSMPLQNMENRVEFKITDTEPLSGILEVYLLKKTQLVERDITLELCGVIDLVCDPHLPLHSSVGDTTIKIGEHKVRST